MGGLGQDEDVPRQTPTDSRVATNGHQSLRTDDVWNAVGEMKARIVELEAKYKGIVLTLAQVEEAALDYYERGRRIRASARRLAGDGE